MIRTTNQYCADNTSATSAITAFAPALASSQAKLLLIDQLDQIAMGTSKGVTLDTTALRKSMTLIALKCANAVIAYATSINNNTLKAQVNYTERKLDKLKKEEVDDVCQTIREATDANMANAQNYGTSPTDTSDLQTTINLYRIGIQNPRQAIINKSNAVSQIKKIIREAIDILLKGQMDKMVLTLKTSNPNFVSKYFGAREIIDLGKTHGKLRGTTTDPAKKPLEKVAIILRITTQTAIAYQTKTDASGKLSIPNIKPNNYDIEVSLPNSQTITETNVHFGPGKELKRKYVLTPVP